jgi:hypothetical protein
VILRPVEPTDQYRTVSLDHDFAHRGAQILRPAPAACPR